MQDLVERPDRYFATVEELLTAERMNQAADLLRSAEIRVERTGFDTWNGGTEEWTVFLSVETVDFALLGAAKGAGAEQISAQLKAVLEPFTEDWYYVKIVPLLAPPGAPARANTGVRRQTRINVIDGLKIDKVNWFGRLDDVEFLARIYDLQALPSHDSRYKDAAGDIYQHRMNNEDWDEDWVYSDSRFSLLSGSGDVFLRFLCEIVHPVVRPDKDEAIRLVVQFNDQLRQDGWQLIEEELIAGRPRFVARRVQLAGGRSVSRARTVADALDAGWMQKEIERLEIAVDADPSLAIGTAKELVESCCKTILTRQKIPFGKSATLP